MKPALVALFLVFGCATTQPKPVTKLGNAGVQTLETRFLGAAYSPDELYVCSGLSGSFTCIPYVDFEEARRGN